MQICIQKNFFSGVEYKRINNFVLYYISISSWVVVNVGSVYNTFCQGNNPQGISVMEQDEETVIVKYCFINITDLDM